MTFNFLTYDSQIMEAQTKTMTKFFSENQLVDYHFVESTANNTFTLLHFKTFGELSFVEYQRDTSEQINTFATTNAYCLQIVLNGKSIEEGPKGRILTTGDSIFIMPGSRFISKDSVNCRKLMIHIPADFLLRTAREFGFFLSPDTTLLDAGVKPFPMTGPLFNLINDMLQQNPTQLGERAMVYYGKLLNSAILTMFKKTNSLSNHPVHRYIQRIHDYILSHITSDIPIDELASLCQISRKSLYNLLEREMGLTPSLYIRRLKLEKAHSDLKSNIQVRNVTQVALKYGFTNLGRFSAHYREQIGELPSQTLRASCR